MDRRTFFFGVVSGVLLVVAVFMLLREVPSSPGKFLYYVTYVVDGDTIDVLGPSGEKERVRFVGIDTPETVDPRKSVQCEGPQASERMKELLLGENVILEAKLGEDKDQYDRFLRYVFLDGQDIGAQMIAEGYAVSLCKKFPHPKCDAYEDLQQKAEEQELGRWRDCRK